MRKGRRWCPQASFFFFRENRIKLEQILSIDVYIFKNDTLSEIYGLTHFFAILFFCVISYPCPTKGIDASAQHTPAEKGEKNNIIISVIIHPEKDSNDMAEKYFSAIIANF